LEEKMIIRKIAGIILATPPLLLRTDVSQGR
jgi:hypothetical protein